MADFGFGFERIESRHDGGVLGSFGIAATGLRARQQQHGTAERCEQRNEIFHGGPSGIPDCIVAPMGAGPMRPSS